MACSIPGIRERGDVVGEAQAQVSLACQPVKLQWFSNFFYFTGLLTKTVLLLSSLLKIKITSKHIYSYHETDFQDIKASRSFIFHSGQLMFFFFFQKTEKCLFVL